MIIKFIDAGSFPISFGSFGPQRVDAIHMSDIECEGTEKQLLSCQHTKQHNCSHREDAGVICQGEYSGYSRTPEC